MLFPLLFAGIISYAFSCSGGCVNGSCLEGGQCRCDSGWKGDRCDIDIDECLIYANICKNGECHNNNGSYSCNCYSGWTGQNCSTDIDDCYPNQCNNNGSCTDHTGYYTCNCTAGYIGKNCEINNTCLNVNCPKWSECNVNLTTKNPQCDCKKKGFTGPDCLQDINECEDKSICANGNCVNENGSFWCNCSEGWEGARCDKRIAYCENISCVNGTCVSLDTKFQCICNSGYTGKLCDTLICKADQCKHGGTCSITTGKCSCLPGFTGKNCEEDINDCAPNPCQNNGKCFDRVNRYQCYCEKNYAGPHCEYKVDACSQNKCRNSADCIIDGNNTKSYKCICPNGFTGNYCETNIDDCVNSRCLNNGKCIDKTNGYHCVCEKQFFGIYCEKARTPIKNCKENCNKERGFCQKNNICACAESYEGQYCHKRKNYCFAEACFNNGSCDSNSSGFTCNCREGYTGSRCQFEIDQCNSCNLFGKESCIRINRKSVCLCKKGYTGEKCEINIDDCVGVSCNHGKCVDGIDDYHCSCEKRWEGSNCTIPVTNCKPGLCNNGKCENATDGYTCYCDENYNGTHCDNLIDNCSTIPCLNGNCHNNTCHCFNGYEGTDCSKYLNRCTNSSCNGHGKCTEIVGSFECQCNDSYSGIDCAIETTICKKCQNGAKCVLSDGKYRCNCTAGFTGEYCSNGTCPFSYCSTTFDGGICQSECNNHACNWDGTDCSLGLSPWVKCEESKKCWEKFKNKKCDRECNNAYCNFDNNDCDGDSPAKCPDKCDELYNNSQCDDICNSKACAYDNLDCNEKLPKLVPGFLVMKVLATPEQFKQKQVEFERKLSIILNSNVVVKEVKVVGTEPLATRKRRASRSLLQVKLKMDNRGCSSNCFPTTKSAARFLAAKQSSDQLNLPFDVKSVDGEYEPPPPPPKTWLVIIFIAIFTTFFLVGAIIGVKRVYSKLWVPGGNNVDGDARSGPDGQEVEEMAALHQPSEEDSPRSIHYKATDMMGSLGSRDWLNNFSGSRGLDATESLLNNVELTPFKSTNFVGSRSEFNLLNELKKGKQDQNLEYILRLFNDGVDVNCRDADGRTPLHLSLYNEDVFNYLINNRSVQIDAQSNDGCTPLMDACKTNEQVVIDELISRGAKVNATNNDGSTPLHFAAAHDNDVGCIILLRNSAKVDAQDNKGQTPVFLASRGACKKAFVVLTQGYANIQASDTTDVSPLKVARQNENHEIVRMLSDAEASPISVTTSPSANSPQFIPIQEKGRKRRKKDNTKSPEKNVFMHAQMPEHAFSFPTPKTFDGLQEPPQFFNGMENIQYQIDTCLHNMPVCWSANDPKVLQSQETTAVYQPYLTPPLDTQSPNEITHSPTYLNMNGCQNHPYLTPSPEWSSTSPSSTNEC